MPTDALDIAASGWFKDLPPELQKIIKITNRLGVEGAKFTAEEVLYIAVENRRAERQAVVEYILKHAKPVRQPVRRHLEVVAEAIAEGKHRKGSDND